jgi:hypothetical protein
VSSPITKRVYNLGLDEFFEWYSQEPRPGFTRATVAAWCVTLEARGLGAVSINVRITAVRKLAVEGADNGLLATKPSTFQGAVMYLHLIRASRAENCSHRGEKNPASKCGRLRGDPVAHDPAHFPTNANTESTQGAPARDLLVAGRAQEDVNPGQCKMPNGAKDFFWHAVACRKLGFWHSPVLAPQIDDFLLRACCTRRPGEAGPETSFPPYWNRKHPSRNRDTFSVCPKPDPLV